MKKMNCYRAIAFLGVLLAINSGVFSQDSAKKELLINLFYHMPASRVPYLVVNTKTKVDKRFQPTGGVKLNVYLDSVANLLAKVITDAKGTARIVFPPSIKNRWDASSTHSFIAVAEGGREFDEATAEASVTKARLVFDTVAEAEARNLRVRVLELKDNEWLPAKDVEMKIGVRRLGGDLPVSEEETYTTDSTGEVIAEFKREKLPGDTAGNLILVAKVEDNEQFGNLEIETKVPWGIPSRFQNNSGQRALWATRDRAPVWLLLMAGFIITIVWGTIIYLVVQIIKIRKLGKSAYEI